MDINSTVALISGLTSLATTLAVKFIFEKRMFVFKIKYEHKANQAKLVREKVAYHKSRLVNSAESLDNRLKNLAINTRSIWYKNVENYSSENYYLDSTVFRFVVFFREIQLLEEDLVYLDTTNSIKSDLRLLKYFRIAKDIMCDVDLFNGFEYDSENQTDHFFSTRFDNNIRTLARDKKFTYEEFLKIKAEDFEKVKDFYDFFNHINFDETRLRMERLKIFHLILIELLNEFGYDYTKTNKSEIKKLRKLQGEYKLLNNYISIKKKYKLKNLNFFLPKMEIYFIKNR